MRKPSRTLKAIIAALSFIPFFSACNILLRDNYSPSNQIQALQTHQVPSNSLESLASEISLEKVNQLVEDIEILELMALKKIHQSEGNLETSIKYALQIGNRMPKYLTLKDKRYFEALDELADYLKLKSKEEIRAKFPELHRLWKTFREYEQEEYKPPISEKEWKEAIKIYVSSLGAELS